jgi:hypothetical protein
MPGEVLARSLRGNANFRFMVELPLTSIAYVAVAAEKDGGERHAMDFGKSAAGRDALAAPSDERRTAALRRR